MLKCAMIKIFTIFILFLTLNASKLQQNYYLNSNYIHIYDIIQNSKKSDILYKISKDKHIKRIKAKQLIKKLKKYGYNNIETKHRYINFHKKSPINTKKLIKFLKKYYQNNYTIIDIQNIHIQPRSYIEKLPKEYTIEIRDRNYLSKNGILDIKSTDNKKIFFNYTIKATLPVYITKYKIKRGNELNLLNTQKKSIILNKFKATPIQDIKIVSLEAKHNIKKGSIITSRDIKRLSLIKKNSFIHVFIHNNNLSISFDAKALDNGKLGDTIRVKKDDNKRLKAVVVGKNIAEIR